MTARLRVEFHCHTNYSRDSRLQVVDLLALCRRKGIDRLVITDHNTISGALAAHELAPDRVIIGEEILTQAGELLAAYVKEEIPPGLPPKEAIARLRDQGAFISVSHPFDRFRKGSWRRSDLESILSDVDAIEVFNARCLWPGDNRAARAFARQHGVLGTVGSDAHIAAEVGQATMNLAPFQDASSLRRALSGARYSTRLSGPWVHLGSRYASWRNRKGTVPS